MSETYQEEMREEYREHGAYDHMTVMKVHVDNLSEFLPEKEIKIGAEHAVAATWTLPALGSSVTQQNNPVQILPLDPLRNRAVIALNGSGQVIVCHSEAQAQAMQNNVTQAADEGCLFTCPAVFVHESSAALWAVAVPAPATTQTTVLGVNPAAGANFSWTNPSAQAVSIQSIQGLFTAGVAVANRTLQYQIQDAAGNVIASVSDTTAVVASTSCTLEAFQGAPLTPAATGTFLAPLPQNMVIPPGGKILLNAIGIQAADTWTAIVIVYTPTGSTGTVQAGALAERLAE